MSVVQKQIFINNKGPLAALRRTQLIELARKHHVDVAHDMAATDMREILEARGIEPQSPDPEPEDFSEKSLFELRKVAKERGIRWSRTDTREILLGKING